MKSLLSFLAALSLPATALSVLAGSNLFVPVFAAASAAWIALIVLTDYGTRAQLKAVRRGSVRTPVTACNREPMPLAA
jgi:hypothetical protein